MATELQRLNVGRTGGGKGTLQWVRDNVKIPTEPLDVVDSPAGASTAGDLRPTDGFGEVHFIGATRKAKGKYARIGNKTDAETAFTLMTKHWRMEQPRLVISVTGGAKSFNLEPRLKKQFATGLFKVAETPGAWVITGGTNTGVMNHVGEALKGATKACIGIASWGIVQNRKALIADDAAKNKQDRAFGGKFPYHVTSSLIEQGAFLDHNHTHFLLVDDGSTKYGREIAFRASLEKLLVERSVPSVLLVLEGGPGTLDTIKGSLNGNVPVVLIKESGRAADLLVNVLETFSEAELDGICKYTAVAGGDVGTNNVIMKIIKETFPGNPNDSEEDNNKTFRKFYDVVVACMLNRKLITVFQMDSSRSVDEAILAALLNSNSATLFRQLQFTLLWNRPDLADVKILSQNVNWTPQDLADVMLSALATNRVEFVMLFLEYGISLTRIVNQNILEFLYGYCISSSMLDTEVQNSYVPAVTESDSDVSSNAIEVLCEDAGLDIKRCAVPMKRVHELIDNLCSDVRQDSRLLTIMSVEESPFRGLFLWAVVNGMHEMAVALWAFEEEGLMKALIAAEINNKLAEKAAGNSNLPDEVEKKFSDNALEFQKLSLQLLEECYKADEKKALKLITGQSQQFNGHTCLEIAVNSNHLDFVSHSSVQALLNDVWTGSIKDSDITTRQFLLSLVFPPYLLTFDFRTESEIKEMVTTDEHPADNLMPALAMALPLHKSNVEKQTDDGGTTLNLRDSKSQLVTSGDRSKNYKTLTDDVTSSSSDIRSTDNRSNRSEMSFFKKFMLFYFKTPCIKFYTNLVAYVVFLLLISYVAMEQKKPMPSIQEFIVIVFVASFTLEEFNQFAQSEYHSLGAKLRDYLSSKWNLVDILANVLFYVALGLRLNQSTEHYGHLLYAFDAAIWILRLLHVFYAHRIMGPYVVMIYRMFVDMMYFLTILLVFMFAYGVCASAILVRHTSATSMIRDVLFRPYFNIYGELFIDRDPESSVMTRFGYPVLNNYAEPVAWVLLGSYLLIANVLLLNLLIAVFGNTFTEVQENASQIWKFQRYQLILEYANRPPLVPPFILLTHIYSFIKWLIRLCTCTTKAPTVGLKSLISKEEREDLDEFESVCLSSFLRSRATDADVDQGNMSDVVEKIKGLQKVLTNMERLKTMEANQ